MPFFQTNDNTVTRVPQVNFALEKDLQSLVEQNLETFFNCKFIASEFSTGTQHAGRIDTLALSEDKNPVIIEYKKVESSDLVNQSLFYLSWIQDHRGDFELAAREKLGNDLKVDWSDIRVICIAPNYKKYDLHAVQVMGANIELWQYRLYENGALYLEEVYKRAQNSSKPQNNHQAALTTETTFTLDSHLAGKPEQIHSWFKELKDFVLNLDESLEENIRKNYIAYRGSTNIVCFELKRKSIAIYLKLLPEDIEADLSIYRDVSQIGHYSTGNCELTISTDSHLEIAKHYIKLAYNKLGG